MTFLPLNNGNYGYSRKTTNRSLSATVAIPCYNAARFLADLLDSLFQQTRPPDEILIIDDGSTDATREIAKKYDVVLVAHDGNLGLARARNTALQHATGDIIVYFDADTLPDRKNIERMLAEYRYPEIAAVGGQELFSRSSRRVDLWRNLFWRQTHGHKRIDSVWMLMGLCCSYRKEILVEMGGFDEEYVTNGEDVDMGIRLTKAGYHQVYVPEIGVFHRRTDTLESLISLAYRHSYWQSRALRKNGTDPSFQIWTSTKWLVISTGSSFVRHKDIILTLMSPIICVSAIVGRSMELVSA
jgi:GT2 family glycosyltransferase